MSVSTRCSEERTGEGEERRAPGKLIRPSAQAWLTALRRTSCLLAWSYQRKGLVHTDTGLPTGPVTNDRAALLNSPWIKLPGHYLRTEYCMPDSLLSPSGWSREKGTLSTEHGCFAPIFALGGWGRSAAPCLSLEVDTSDAIQTSLDRPAVNSCWLASPMARSLRRAEENKRQRVRESSRPGP